MHYQFTSSSHSATVNVWAGATRPGVLKYQGPGLAAVRPDIQQVFVFLHTARRYADCTMSRNKG